MPWQSIWRLAEGGQRGKDPPMETQSRFGQGDQGVGSPGMAADRFAASQGNGGRRILPGDSAEIVGQSDRFQAVLIGDPGTMAFHIGNRLRREVGLFETAFQRPAVRRFG